MDERASKLTVSEPKRTRRQQLKVTRTVESDQMSCRTRQSKSANAQSEWAKSMMDARSSLLRPSDRRTCPNIR